MTEKVIDVMHTLFSIVVTALAEDRRLPSGRVVKRGHQVRMYRDDVAKEGDVKAICADPGLAVEGYTEDGMMLERLPPSTRPDPPATFRVLPVVSVEKV